MVVVLFFCLAAAAITFGEEQTFQATVGTDGIQHVDMVGGSYFFNPNHIIVKVLIPVQITVRKEGGIIPHDIVFNSPEAGISAREELSKEAKTITFTPTKTGSYPFYCDKKPPFGKSHKERGMEGVLEVVD
jgi:plastocyanin domain-containing protein